MLKPRAVIPFLPTACVKHERNLLGKRAVLAAEANAAAVVRRERDELQKAGAVAQPWSARTAIGGADLAGGCGRRRGGSNWHDLRNCGESKA